MTFPNCQYVMEFYRHWLLDNLSIDTNSVFTYARRKEEAFVSHIEHDYGSIYPGNVRVGIDTNIHLHPSSNRIFSIVNQIIFSFGWSTYTY